MDTLKALYSEWDNIDTKIRKECIKYLKETLAQQEDNQIELGEDNAVLVLVSGVNPQWVNVTDIMLIDDIILLNTMELEELDFLDICSEEMLMVSLAVHNKLEK